MSEETPILFTIPEPGIARICLHRPQRLNAYSTDLCRMLCDAVARFRADDALRVMILTGAGRAFCAGGDIRGDAAYAETARRQLGHAEAMREGIHAALRAIFELDKPVIAAVNGAAVAGGLALALVCDFRIASDRARLGDTSGRFGLLPDEGGAWLFPRILGLERALRMTLLHETYDAAEAQRLGLVSEVVAHDTLEARALELARALAQRAPLAIRMAKRLMRQGLERSFSESLEDAAHAVLVVNESEDAREGVRAFVEKRTPKFVGR
jgi:2-(1,2-epoxy-1,2-dihydrophenyl)acetyl-CoA isomerase